MNKKSSSSFSVDCRELTMDEELALASEISDSLKGGGIALVDGPKIVFDSFTNDKGEVDAVLVEQTIKDFISRRKDHQFYSVEKVADDSGDGKGGSLVVHSADPVTAASRRRATEKLPPNLIKCPFCPFVTPYEEYYVIHVRSHGFGM